MQAFHGTLESNATDICVHGFSTDRFPNWHGDLGRGVYAYTEAEDMGYASPAYLARRYAEKKRGYHTASKIEKVRVLHLNLEVDVDALCDLNDTSVVKRFIANRKNFEKALHARLMKIRNKSGAAERDNEDGILLESLIQKHVWPNYDVIMRDTYTAFEAKTSTIPNGREVCIRHLSVIKQIDPV